jgi:hypothetical protein
MAVTPLTLSRDKRDHWQLKWLHRYAVPFANWLKADPVRMVQQAKRIQRGEPYSDAELKAIALELEKF